MQVLANGELELIPPDPGSLSRLTDPPAQALSRRTQQELNQPGPSRLVQPPRRTTYKVAAAHPVELQDVPAHAIVKTHCAARFLPALASFIQGHGSAIGVSSEDEFDLYKQIEVALPAIPEVSPTKLKNVIRATPPVPAAPRRAPEAAYLDFAFVRTGEENASTRGTVLEGRFFLRLPYSTSHYLQDYVWPTLRYYFGFQKTMAYAQITHWRMLSGSRRSASLTLSVGCTLSQNQRGRLRGYNILTCTQKSLKPVDWYEIAISHPKLAG